MRHPLRSVPSIARRRRRPPPDELLLAIPRLSPERELAVLQALMKPQRASAVRHHLDSGEQPWPADADRRVSAVAALAVDRFQFPGELLLPAAGEYFLLARFAPADLPAATATALLLSAAFPGVWVTAGRWFIRDGVIHRRERGVKLHLKVAKDAHLPRPLRSAVQSAVRTLNVR